MEEIIYNDYNVTFDFIADKMLKLNERIIFAKKLMYNDSITGDYLIYKVVTADGKGHIRSYIKDLQKGNNYIQIGTV